MRDAIQVNRFLSLNRDETQFNKNVLLHPISPAVYQELALGFYLLRVLSVILTLLMLEAAFHTVQLLAPEQTWLQLAALAVVALNPLTLVVGTAAAPFALVTCLFVTGAMLVLMIAKSGVSDWRWFILLGGVVGVAALSNLYGVLAGLLIPLAVMTLPARAGARPRQHFLLGGAAVLVAFAIAGWWYIRVWMNYGRLVPLQPLMPAQTTSDYLGLGRFRNNPSYLWGVFGWGNITLSTLYYTVMSLLSALGAFGLILGLGRYAWRERGLRGLPWQIWLAAAAWTGLLWLTTVTINLTYPAVIGLLGALPIIATGLTAGLRFWVPQRFGRVVMLVFPILLAISSILAPWRQLSTAYRSDAVIAMDQVPADLQPVNLRYGDELELLGYQMPSTHVPAGQALTMRVYWLVLRQPRANYWFRYQLTGRNQRVIGLLEAFPDYGRLATSTLPPGTVFEDLVQLPIDAGAVAPTAGSLRVSVHDPDTNAHIEAQSLGGIETVPAALVTRLAVTSIEPVSEAPQVAIDLNFDDKIQLLGFDLSTTEPRAGEGWRITLYWRLMVPLNTDYTVFVHLLDDKGAKLVQLEEQPFSNYYPTSMWLSNEIVQDTHTLLLPADLPEGNYTLSVGLMLSRTGQRLPLVGKTPGENDLLIGPYAVSSN